MESIYIFNDNRQLIHVSSGSDTCKEFLSSRFKVAIKRKDIEAQAKENAIVTVHNLLAPETFQLSNFNLYPVGLNEEFNSAINL